MYVGELHAGEIWTDVLKWKQDEVKIGDDGFGFVIQYQVHAILYAYIFSSEFRCPAVSVSVFVNKDAKGREEFGKYTAEIDGLAKRLKQA